MEPEILETSRQQLLADRRSDALPPHSRMHGVGDLALPLPSAPDVKLTHADNVARDTRRIGEPLLR